jgi:exopolyphosphatase/guanosine-5'-triphosphate,3'-diphosphate pyrophosphatase
MTPASGQSNGQSKTKRTPRKVKVAALDVGSNAVRLMVAEIGASGTFKVVRDERVGTQLGKGLAETGTLNPGAIAGTVEAVARFAALAKGRGIAARRVVATAAVREAGNGKAFLDRVRRETGVEIEVISPDEEGSLAFLSLARRFDVAEVPAASVDIGGGSAQVILSTHGVAAKIASMPLGAVRLTDQFGGWGAMATKAFPKLCRFVDDQIEAALRGTPVKPRILVGTGGAVTSVAMLAQAHRIEEGGGGRGEAKKRKTDTTVDVKTLRAMIQAFRDEAPNLPGFAADAPADRGPILFAGLIVLDRLADHLGIRVVHSHAGGLREGVCWSLADRALSPTGGMLGSARELAARSRYDKTHSEHVAVLAGGLLKSLADVRAVREALRHEPGAGRLLEASAVLHDIGTLVGYAKHHKHSRDMVLATDLQGFSRREQLIVANVVRYHRRVGPRASHRLFSALSAKDQHLVRVLSGVLRVADGLDRSHESLVTETAIEIRKGTLTVLATAQESGEDLSRERRAAKGKADVLAGLVGMKVAVKGG